MGALLVENTPGRIGPSPIATSIFELAAAVVVPRAEKRFRRQST
jgi:hypothetical protein